MANIMDEPVLLPLHQPGDEWLHLFDMALDDSGRLVIPGASPVEFEDGKLTRPDPDEAIGRANSLYERARAHVSRSGGAPGAAPRLSGYATELEARADAAEARLRQVGAMESVELPTEWETEMYRSAAARQKESMALAPLAHRTRVAERYVRKQLVRATLPQFAYPELTLGQRADLHTLYFAMEDLWGVYPDEPEGKEERRKRRQLHSFREVGRDEGGRYAAFRELAREAYGADDDLGSFADLPPRLLNVLRSHFGDGVVKRRGAGRADFAAVLGTLRRMATAGAFMSV